MLSIRNFFSITILAAGSIWLGLEGCTEVPPPIDFTETVYETGIGTPAAPDEKVVLIEDFTGAACPNCPDAHIAITNTIAAHPEQVVAVAEYNYFADPLYPDQNFITDEALSLNDYLGPAIGWPAVFIDRKNFDADDYIAEIPANILPYTETQLAADAPCNIAITNNYDAATRTLQVQVRVDYTANITAINHLSVMLIESDIEAAQIDDNVGGEVEDYIHNHVLRDMLSYYAGDALPESNVAGRWYIFNYTYTVPEAWNTDHMYVVGFVHNYETDNKESLQAAEAPLY